MKFIDTNCSIGHWPFTRLPSRGPASLAQRLREHGIERALVSPLEALFQPDPDPCNRKLLEACREQPTLVPAPVLNLTLANWEKSLQAYRRQGQLVAVKLYPNFHNYRLDSRPVHRLAQISAELGFRLIVNARMVDERHQYFALKVKGVPTRQLIALAQRHPSLPFLFTGLYRAEILEVGEKAPNARFDLSFADGHQLVKRLTNKLPADRFLFGSHTPLMVTKANTFKLETADVPRAIKEQIAYRNAASLFFGEPRHA